MLINMVLSLVALPTLVWFVKPKFLAREDLIIGESVDISKFTTATSNSKTVRRDVLTFCTRCVLEYCSR